MPLPFFSLISVPGSPDGTNEDGWAAVQDPRPPGWVMAAVIDGASVRGLLPSLAIFLTEHGGEPQPAAWATALVRDAFYCAFMAQPPTAPLESLLAANQALRIALEAVPGMVEIFDLLERSSIEPLPEVMAHCSEPLATDLRQVFVSLFPDRWSELDTRYLRLVLPACVTTVVRLNLSTGVYAFAHAGDTALIKVDAAHEISTLTQDQMSSFDDQALDLALQAVREPGNQVAELVQAIEVIPAIRETNLLNGVRHNYVNENGQTQPGQGCGVIDGLTALRDYIQTGEGTLAPGERLYLMSDGFTLPMSSTPENLPSSLGDSLIKWRQALHRGDLRTMSQLLRYITDADTSRYIFPRFKHRDDATALSIEILE